MHIWLVTVGEPLPKVDAGNPRLLRAGMLARFLANRGHAVVWWTSTFDHSHKRQRFEVDTALEWNGVDIRMLHGRPYRRNLSLRRFLNHFDVARGFRIASRSRPVPDVMLVSLPTIELARDAVRYAREYKVPVLVDVRDLWPDLIHDSVPATLRPLARVVLSWLDRGANEALSQCNGIIGISRGYLDWGLHRAGRCERWPDAVFPLGYQAPQVAAQQLGAARERLLGMGVEPGRMLCWYVGSFGRQYDLEAVLLTAAALQRAGRQDVQFVISGDGDQGPRWRAMAASLRNVVLTGWIDGDAIAWLRLHAAIGLQPYAAGAPQGLANKLFEYLSAGIPVLSSLGGENEQLLAEYQCGLTYRPADAKSFEECLRRLLDDAPARIAMGLRGRKLFDSQFDAELVLQGMTDHLQQVAAQRVAGALS
jgi:glycosyltransferase involved in cell wall biosynthesis